MLLLFSGIILLFFLPQTRLLILVLPIFKILKRQNLRISTIERQTLNIGNVGFEKGFFLGRPDWEGLRALPKIELTAEEKKFLDEPVEKLCRITNDWEIRQKYKEIPQFIWDFAKENKLLALRIPKKCGGVGLSFQAQSLILNKIASRSVDVATIVELSTSLWPDEIIEKYGTDEQKKYYTPRLANGEEIISFAITGISNGSDATSMQDSGIIEYGIYERKKILGIRLNLKKRYITFAPQATLLVVGFRLFDPDNFLGKGNDIGITTALISANHPGINIGRRHLPMNVAFPNGPISGKDVFIPIDWIIGGKEKAGEGWKMVVESLFVGRAIAIPSICVGVIKSALRNTAAYTRIRRQFGSYIGKFEGIEEVVSRLIGIAYATDSARMVASAMSDAKIRPLAVSALMKYRTTELMRQAVNVAIDIHAGRAICDGPSNYLMSGFLASPIGIAVEGANIIMRSVVTFAQGILQSHPYLLKELEACEDPDKKRGLEKFEKAFLKHILLFISNLFRALFHNITFAAFGKAPKNIPEKIAKFYRDLWRISCNFACLSDLTIFITRAKLKKKQKFGGRLADIFSELFFLSSTLKRYEDEGFRKEDYPILQLCMENGLYRIQSSFAGIIDNFPNPFLRFALRFITFPFGARKKPANDATTHQVAKSVLEPNDILDRLTKYAYISKNPEDVTGRLEVAFKKAVELEEVQKKIDLAIRNKEITRVLGVDHISEAEKKGIITTEEALQLREFEKLVELALEVDHFDPQDVLTSFRNYDDK